MSKSITISDYLINKLYEAGVRHVFGIPGDFVLNFFKKLEESKLKLVNVCDEQGAGYAADAYARVNGLGVVCVTYCVGGLKVANTTAQAYAEESPVIVISGAPGIREREKNPLLHHKVKDFDTQKKIFEQLTVASTVIDDPQTAFEEIDRVLHAVMQHKRPGYIEIPRDMALEKGILRHRSNVTQVQVDRDALQEAIEESTAMINAAKKPVVIAGVEIQRFGLQELLLEFIEKTKIPAASTLLGKSVISERHPSFIGVYEGAIGRQDVLQRVESADCLILLGALLTDIDLGLFTARLNQKITIYAASEKVSIRYHQYDGVDLKSFMQALVNADIHQHTTDRVSPAQVTGTFVPKRNTKITVKRLFEKLNTVITDDTVVIADVGDALFGAADLCIHSKTEFLSPAYYASLGFSVPASIGVQMANPALRPLVIVGDGAFQMTGMELTTVVRYKLNPIIVLLNNNGYGTERPILDGSFNDIHSWNYSKIPEILGCGYGFVVETEEEFDDAITKAWRQKDSFNIIEVKLDNYDFSPALIRMTSCMAKQVRK